MKQSEAKRPIPQVLTALTLKIAMAGYAKRREIFQRLPGGGSLPPWEQLAAAHQALELEVAYATVLAFAEDDADIDDAMAAENARIRGETQ